MILAFVFTLVGLCLWTFGAIDWWWILIMGGLGFITEVIVRYGEAGPLDSLGDVVGEAIMCMDFTSSTGSHGTGGDYSSTMDTGGSYDSGSSGGDCSGGGNDCGSSDCGSSDCGGSDGGSCGGD